MNKYLVTYVLTTKNIFEKVVEAYDEEEALTEMGQPPSVITRNGNDTWYRVETKIIDADVFIADPNDDVDDDDEERH